MNTNTICQITQEQVEVLDKLMNNLDYLNKFIKLPFNFIRYEQTENYYLIEIDDIVCYCFYYENSEDFEIEEHIEIEENVTPEYTIKYLKKLVDDILSDLTISKNDFEIARNKIINGELNGGVIDEDEDTNYLYYENPKDSVIYYSALILKEGIGIDEIAKITEKLTNKIDIITRNEIDFILN